MKICFLCNHLIAIPALETLLQQQMVVGLSTPAINHEATARVRTLAQRHNLPYIAVEPHAIEAQLTPWLAQIAPDLVIVFTFPYKIPAAVLDIPSHGFYNVHPGLLPAYRGPDPTFWQIKNQEKMGGLTIHRMAAEFDTGPIAREQKVPIAPGDTHGLHLGKLALTGANLLGKVVERLPTMNLKKQNAGRAAYQSRPQPQDLVIDWANQSAKAIEALIRASNPEYGGAITTLRGGTLHLLQGSIHGLRAPTSALPGTIIQADATNGIDVRCRDQKVLRLEVVYTEGGFFTGGQLATLFNIQAGEILTTLQAHG